MAQEQRPPNLPGNVWAFIYAYVSLRDKEKAAMRARFRPGAGRKLFAVPAIYSEIKRLIDQQDKETAKLIAASNKLTVEFLDTAMVETIENLEPSHAKVKAIELAYTRTGVLDKGSLIVAPPAPPSRTEAPQIYRALQTTTVRRTTEEVIQQKELTSSQPVIPQLTQQPAKQLVRGEEVEILDYNPGIK